MLRRFLFCLFLALPLFAGDTPLWVLEDPRGDDYGDGTLLYPMSADFDRGDLDLLRLEAFDAKGGTRFVATFARPIKRPPHRTVDAIGTQLDQLARHGFYTFNIDIYIDTDGVRASGATSALPGRRVWIDEATAWEKIVCLTPDPALAKMEMKRILARSAKQRAKVVSDDERRALILKADDRIFFPTRITVTSNRVEFFVPDSFLGGTASPQWSYAVAVSGADVVDRTDQQGRLMDRTTSTGSLLILPVASGRPIDRFGGAAEDDSLVSALVDIIVPAGEDQRKVLATRDLEKGVPAVLHGVKP